MKMANCTYNEHECLDDNGKVIAECPFDDGCTPECTANYHACMEEEGCCQCGDEDIYHDRLQLCEDCFDSDTETCYQCDLEQRDIATYFISEMVSDGEYSYCQEHSKMVSK